MYKHATGNWQLVITHMIKRKRLFSVIFTYWISFEIMTSTFNMTLHTHRLYKHYTQELHLFGVYSIFLVLPFRKPLTIINSWSDLQSRKIVKWDSFLHLMRMSWSFFDSRRLTYHRGKNKCFCPREPAAVISVIIYTRAFPTATCHKVGWDRASQLPLFFRVLEQETHSLPYCEVSGNR